MFVGVQPDSDCYKISGKGGLSRYLYRLKLKLRTNKEFGSVLLHAHKFIFVGTKTFALMLKYGILVLRVDVVNSEVVFDASLRIAETVTGATVSTFD